MENIVAQIPLSVPELKDIDNLVAVDKFNNRSDAIKWLVTRGIAANRGHLDEVADTRRQIERLKEELQGGCSAVKPTTYSKSSLVNCLLSQAHLDSVGSVTTSLTLLAHGIPHNML